MRDSNGSSAVEAYPPQAAKIEIQSGGGDEPAGERADARWRIEVLWMVLK
ncbi:MAG: hypothetical protein JXB62_14820 [Pirellulales bacterium]|nr:hypothetical protein [Pirellulales bacterium]